MATATIESKQMGRPKKTTGTVSIRINEDALEVVRKACVFKGETVVEYASRVLMGQAEKDLDAGVEEYQEAKRKNRAKGDR